MLKTQKMDNNLDVFGKENFGEEALDENFDGTLETFAVFVPTDVVNLTKVPDDYDYDMEASHSTFFWDELLPTLIVYCLTFVLGLVGNVLIIFTIFRYRKMKSTTNVFLASLASSDLLLILFCIPVKDGPRLEETRKERRSHVKNPESYKALKIRREKQEPHSKLSKKDLIYLELKPFMRAKTAKEPVGARPEMRKHRKPTGKSKTKEAGISRPESSLPSEKLPSFHNTWEYTNYSIVPTLSANRTRDWTKKKEHKRKHSDRVKKKNEPIQLSETKIDNQKNMEVILGGSNKKNKKVEVLYPPFKDFVTNRPNYRNESGGEAVVIYHRHNRRNYLHPQTGDGYQFEHISFSGSCETTVDLVQSKRSLSEPRQNSTKEFYVTRRRTRFQLEPHKRTSTQSDFHSAIDFLKQSSGSVEFQNFGEMNNSITRFIYKNPSSHDCRKWGEKKNVRHSNQPMMKKSKSSTDSSAMVKTRLKQMAEKKLNLHREMVREEEMSKKKFWESIERSLNYRCAVAEMFSSQSYLSSNESSRFFRSTENPSVRSTNIYVRESVIEKISSYQGFRRYFTSNQSGFQKNTQLKNLNQPSNPTFSQMKAVLDTFLIKEDEEIFIKQEFEDSCISQSSSDSMVQTDVSPYDLNDSIFSFSASEKLTLMESNLCTSDTHSKLELLMSKLSEEIRKCSSFMKKFSESTPGNTVKRSSAKLSASDSKIELNENVEKKINKKKSFISCGWSTSEERVCPVLVYSACDDSLNHFYDTFYNKQKINKKPKSSNDHEVDGNSIEIDRESNSLDPTVLKNLNIADKTESNQTIRSYKNDSLASTGGMTQTSHSVKKFQNKSKEFPCCDDCILLKKRIIKLEKELGKIEKKMPLYPKEYQESIKNCLQNLNGTSETFLKRLKSCAKLRYLDNKSRKKCKNDSKRSTSSPGPIVEESTKEILTFRPSNSDYQLNVGMEITMENVDPVTGKKLHPDANKDFQQEGNIQCRMFKDGEKPILMMDTDFLYNPSTGMLFKSKGSHSSENPATDYIIPMDSIIKKAPSATDLVKTYGKPFQAYECRKIDTDPIRDEFVLPKKPRASQRDVSTQGSSCPFADADTESGVPSDEESKNKEDAAVDSRETGTSPRSTGSFIDVWDSKEVRPGSRESKKEMKISWFGRKKNKKAEKSFSRIPVRRKPTPSSASSKADLVSPKSSLMSFITVPPLSECCISPSDTSRIFFKSRERSKRALQSLQRVFNRPISREPSFMHKSTQTYEKFDKFEYVKPEIEKMNAVIQTRSEVRHFGVQVVAKNQSEGIQTYSNPPGCQDDMDAESESESHSLSLTENSLKSIYASQMSYSAPGRSSQSMTVNVAIQADYFSEKKPQTVSVGFQTNLPTEENLKYLNDLQIQKKVNMAIAELCFHLSQKNEQQKV